MLEKIMSRMEALGKQLEQSAANHNALVGAMAELKNLYAEAVQSAPAVEAVVSVVDPTAAPVVDASISTVEGIVKSVE